MQNNLTEKNELLKKDADRFLYELGLDELIKEYGDYKIDGSYAYDMMVWRDLDLYVDSSKMNIDKVHELMATINARYKPFWFMGKEDVSGDGEVCFFIGFETKILDGITWNFDIWFISDFERTKKDNYHEWIKSNIKKHPELKERMLAIKTDVFKTKEYGSKFFSIDVYKAVIDDGVTDVTTFKGWLKNR